MCFSMFVFFLSFPHTLQENASGGIIKTVALFPSRDIARHKEERSGNKVILSYIRPLTSIEGWEIFFAFSIYCGLIMICICLKPDLHWIAINHPIIESTPKSLRINQIGVTSRINYV